MIVCDDFKKKRIRFGMLLYLSPQRAQKMAELLNELHSHLEDGSHRSQRFFAIRTELKNILLLLTPVSRTRRILDEIITLTDYDIFCAPEILQDRIDELFAIYWPSRMKTSPAAIVDHK